MMNSRAARWAKRALTQVGAKLGARAIHGANAALNYLETGRWFRARGFDVSKRAAHRDEVYRALAARIGDEKVLYLEFGVWQGEATRIWRQLLRRPDARLFGFDSFEGLPEDWNIGSGKGHFSTRGAVPQLDDPRVTFVKGWFDQTLPKFEVPAHQRLVLNLDADLYSSTELVLRLLESHLKIGALVYFDEFCDRAHELRAFDEYLERTGHRFEVVLSDETLAHVGFQRIG